MENENIKLYYHKTSGGAEYLCSSAVEGTDEGSFDSKFLVRIDGHIGVYDREVEEYVDHAELTIKN